MAENCSKISGGRSAAKNLIGLRVREARQALRGRVTQDEFSGRLAAMGLQLDRAAVAKVELGLRHVYDYELGPIADVLKVDVRWLLRLQERGGPDDLEKVGS